MKVIFVDECDFQKEGKWYILSKNSRFEVCSNSSFRYKRLAGGHIRFWRKYDALHDGSKNDTDSDYNTEPSIISTISSSFNLPAPPRFSP